MKKALLITWTIALIVFCSTIKIKAMTLDGEYVRPFDTGTNGYWYFDLANQQSDQKDVNFTNSFSPREGEKYIVVAIQGGEQYTWEDDYNSSNNFNQGVVNLYYRISLKSNGAWQTCELQNNLIVCPIKNGDTYTGIRFYLDNPYNYSGSVYIKMNQYISIYKNINTEIQNAINNQTQQNQNNYDNFMNETQQYNDEQNTNISGVNETIQYEQAEEQLIQSIDTNTSVVDEIVINPLASAFIWDIVGGLRNMNPAIIVLMTSMLGFGIVKLILNR